MNTTGDNRDVIVNSDIIILAVKPYQILDVMTEIHDIYAAAQSAGNRGPAPRSLRPLIVSVAAVISLSEIEKKVSECGRDSGVQYSNTICNGISFYGITTVHLVPVACKYGHINIMWLL